MKSAVILGFAALALAAPVLAEPVRVSTYERHVVFDNARTDGPWYYSRAEAIAPSALTLTEGKIPVVTDRSHSPPNALKIEWTSATGGGWWVSLDAMRERGLFDYSGDTISLWVWSDDELTAANTPRIALADRAGRGVPTIDLVRPLGRIPPGRWTELRFPLALFAGLERSTNDDRLDLAALRNILLIQGLDDGVPHRIWIDDIRVIDSKTVDAAAPAAPAALRAKGYDRHIDLAWDKGRDADIESYRIYRAFGAEAFRPIALQRGDWSRYADYLGESGKAARYRIAAVDSAGNESPLSAEVSASTRALDDAALLDMVQEAHFRYYWDGAHPDAGMALELTPGDPDQVALGSSGWGVNAILVGAQRGFVTRQQALEGMQKIVRFLDRAPRYHGAWAHFINGRTAQTMPVFGKYDNGGDLVETAFMIQGLLAARQYFDRTTPDEQALRAAITRFWHEVEWDWYRQSPDSPYLYWHWSPDYGFHINHRLIGWNETGIVYLLAIASPTHPVPASLWHSGYASQDPIAVRYRQGWSRTTKGDHYRNGTSYYGRTVQVGEGSGAELFFQQFNFMGMDPRGKRDAYADYFTNARAVAEIARAYAIDNPLKCKGYGADAWGRSAGVLAGGGRSLPVDDNCTLVVHASLGMMPFTPEASMAALKHYYRDLGAKTWGIYGFSDSFNETLNFHDEVYMALNQAPTVAMIENYRSGLIWRMFMKNPEIAPALKAMGFRPDPQR